MSAIHSEKINLNSDDPVEILLNRTFLWELRRGFARYGPNRVCLPISFDQEMDGILNMKVNDSDIFTISFPKSGTTWTQEMVWCIANDLDFKGAEKRMKVRFPSLDNSMLFDFATYLSENPEATTVFKYSGDSVSMIDKMECPRFIKTHLPWELLPRQIQTGAKKPKIIYVTRNPKDVCVSHFHYSQIFEKYTGNFDEFVTLFTENLISFAPYWRHIHTYWSHQHDLNILIIRYEDMKEDLGQVIRQVAKFLDKTLTEEQISVLEQHLSFDSMKNNPAVNFENMIRTGQKWFNYPPGHFMRTGQVGNYKTLMTPSTIDKINRWSEKNVDGQFRDDFKDYLI